MTDETYVEWSRMTQTGLRELQEAIGAQYERIKRFRVYEPGVVPGLLQTSGYATALMGAIIGFQGIPDDTAAAVAARMARAKVLHEGNHDVTLLMEEWVLRSRIGGVEVMRDQLEHLRTATTWPRVKVGIIPMTTARVMWPVEGFFLFDEDEVKIELASAEVTLTKANEIETYARTFAELSRMAVFGEHARALIDTAAALSGELAASPRTSIEPARSPSIPSCSTRRGRTSAAARARRPSP